MAFDLLKDFDSLQYLENKLTYLSPNFVYALILTRSRLGLLHVIFRSSIPELWPLIYARISLPHKYLEIEMTEFHQILHMPWYWQDLGWDCYKSFFTHLFQSYGPWFIPEFRFRSISWGQTDRFSLNSINALLLTISRLGLYNVIFSRFETESWPKIYARILFPLNILRTNCKFYTRLYIIIHIDKI